MPRTARPTLLPLVPAHGGGRAAMTCRYRCGDACFHAAPNTSANPYFGDVLTEALSRRSVLRAGAVVALATGAAATQAGPAAAGPPPHAPGGPAVGLRFEPISQQTGDRVTVPPGYLHDVLVRWGDPLFSDAPEFDPENQTAAAQARQFGYNNDHLGLLPLGHHRDDHVLVVNHEYTNEEIMFPAYDPENPTRQQVEVAWAAHGLTVVAVTGSRRGRRSGALDVVVDHELNRRLPLTAAFELTGPAAGSEYVRTHADPDGRTVLGTLNNCAGGLTPWGTWLTGEENFHQYFAHAEAVTDEVARERLARYGVLDGESERKWERFDPRWDLAQEPNEVNRFGWVVEVDPYDPSSTPRKRTALGRLKHEGATIRLSDDGRAVAYMGDDERFEYLYKFVSHERYRRGDRAHNMTLLENGTLYVARLTGDSPPAEIDGSGALPGDGEFDGSGEWIPLVSGTTSHVPGMTPEEVLVFTRQAADAMGATKMDRPEDVEPHPRTGVVYAALTNNTARTPEQADEANPRAENKHGQVLELAEEHGDAAAGTFGWRLLLVCGDPEDESTYFAGFDKSQVSPISCPDNVAFDSHGNLWISTDGQPGSLGTNDALYGVAVSGRRRGEVRQFLAVPTGAETCGPVITDRRVLVAVQHPGEIDGATYEDQASHWPDGGTSVPRPSVVVTYRADGRRIGQA
ncbi:PhoX family protein [Georgenia alba]|uniref:PhoX family protein n=1 Tax=Georgenia alba TaxID=2233858 RepID=A0ABW2Q4P4_9MICO